MSAVPADALGHSYFAANSGAISIFFRLLWRVDPPPSVAAYHRKASAAFTIWWFDAEAPARRGLLEAGFMLETLW